VTHASDKILFRRIEQATAGGRALLCTLGRLGKTFRHNQPARAGVILLASQSHPVYKCGRLLFDLLELEDLMLDGPPPETLDKDSMAKSLRSTMSAFGDLTRVLMEVAEDISKGARAEKAEAENSGTEEVGAEENPASGILLELDSSEYLFDLVVLGTLSELARLITADGSELPAPG
jgi:hypothetical protein